MSIMTIEKYLSEIEYAATELISLVWRETTELERLKSELKPLTLAVQREYEDAHRIAM